MSVIKSRINPRSPEFAANAAAMRALVADLRDKVLQVALGGSAAALNAPIAPTRFGLFRI